MDDNLLSVSDARQRLLAELQPLPAEEVALTEALGRVLAEPIVAGHDLPPFHNASVDGYAVDSASLRSAARARPIVLPVAGEVTAGRLPDRPLERGQALRITTGAPLPAGADAVVPVEDTDDAVPMLPDQLPSQVAIHAAVPAGANVRRAGMDVRRGAVALPAGTRLRPAEMGLLAALGAARLRVYRRARVAVLSSGDELLEIGLPLIPGRIYDANGVAIAAAVQSAGALALRLGILPDRRQAVIDGLERAVAEGADLILSTAGVSVGAHDFVREAVLSAGSLTFWRVNLRPGKPLAVGTYRGRPFLGLPGNPVSALVTFEIFVRPALQRLHGEIQTRRWRLRARLEEPLASDGRESYLRARVRWANQEYHARLTGSQDSAVLSSLVSANALIVVPPGVQSLEAGAYVEAWVLDPDAGAGLDEPTARGAGEMKPS